MLLVAADDAHDTTPAHDLALVTDFLDRRPDLHQCLLRLFEPPAALCAAILTTSRQSGRGPGRWPSIARAPDPQRSPARNSVPPDSPDGRSPRAVPRAPLEPANSAAARGRRRPRSSQAAPAAPSLRLTRCLALGYADTRSASTAASGKVSTRHPSSVTTTVCSKCADSARSFVTAVQPSPSTLTAGLPAFTLGSMARAMPRS